MVNEKQNHKYGFLEPGLLGTNYAKKVKFLEVNVQSSMLKTDYEMLQYPHCKCNNLGTLVGKHNFKLFWESFKPLPYQKLQVNKGCKY